MQNLYYNIESKQPFWIPPCMRYLYFFNTPHLFLLPIKASYTVNVQIITRRHANYYIPIIILIAQFTIYNNS